MNDFYAAALAEGFSRPGARHTGATFDVVGGPLRIIPDDDLERAADQLRPTLALYIGGMGARGVNYHHEVFARMGYEAQARAIQDRYLAGDRKGAIAAVPTRMVEDVALIGPWAKIADEVQRWQQTVLTTFSVAPSCAIWTGSWPCSAAEPAAAWHRATRTPAAPAAHGRPARPRASAAPMRRSWAVAPPSANSLCLAAVK